MRYLLHGSADFTGLSTLLGIKILSLTMGTVKSAVWVVRQARERAPRLEDYKSQQDTAQ